MDAIEDLNEAFFSTVVRSLDCRQGFHQILIRFLDQKKTAFFDLEGDT
jgi:hypothetical protein